MDKREAAAAKINTTARINRAALLASLLSGGAMPEQQRGYSAERLAELLKPTGK